MNKELLIVLGIAVGFVALKGFGKVSEIVANVGEAVNPLNDSNVFNQTVTKVGQKVTGDAGFSLGEWIYDVTHDDPTADALAGLN